MRIIFIEPSPPDFHIFSRFNIPRLGTLILGTILKQAGHDVEVMVETVERIDYKKLLDADLIGISAITSTAKRSYALADELLKHDKTVIFGGPHPSFFPEESLEHGHFVIRGEAEKSILPFIKAVEEKTGLEKIPGLSFRIGDRVFHNPMEEPCLELDTLPFPDFSLLNSNIGDIKPMITSRGCPYDCSFCAVTELFGRKYRFRQPENVLKELVSMNIKKGDTVFFYDDNFVANVPNTKQLLRLMIENKLTPPWTAQVRVDCSKDEELLELMKKSGCVFVYMGLESINPETLKSFKKKQTLEQIEQGVARFHKHGIRVHGMFVLGADADEVSTIRETAKFALKNKIETVQFMILTPIPGTRFFREMESQDRLLTRDWSLYDGHHVVFRPDRMTPYQLQKETMKAMAKFYSVWQLIRLFLRFDFFTFIYRSYGNSLVNRWQRQKMNRRYYRMMKEISKSATAKLGDNVRKTAEDIRVYFKRLRSKKLSEPSR
jgi:anaerobic magnesium-protoporphyrin IX monomethyl ester cyclase